MHLGRAEEARPLVDGAAKYSDEHLKGTPNAPYGDLTKGSWQDWYPIQILRREAQELLCASKAGEKLHAPESKAAATGGKKSE